nr:MAG TPA: hypothetical protein [Caudoviricetes sp.]
MTTTTATSNSISYAFMLHLYNILPPEIDNDGDHRPPDEIVNTHVNASAFNEYHDRQPYSDAGRKDN